MLCTWQLPWGAVLLVAALAGSGVLCTGQLLWLAEEKPWLALARPFLSILTQTGREKFSLLLYGQPLQTVFSREKHSLVGEP